MTNFERVLEWHSKFGAHIGTEPKVHPETLELRLKLIDEEVDELNAEFGQRQTFDQINLQNVAKEMADILYVVYGAAVTMGIDLDHAFKLVHESNMSKLDPDTGKPVLREDGKILKGKAYQPPDMEKILKPIDNATVKDVELKDGILSVKIDINSSPKKSGKELLKG